MSKRTTFTTISPLPAGISRDAVLDFLHNHLEMIDLNPLIKERHVISPPAHAPPEEHSCVWYSLTDEISYLPGGLATGNVTYTCAFHDLPTGLQTHCYAPMGLEIRDKWTVAGSLPGEPIEPVELGIGAPLTGLYLREDVDMRCNVFTSSFVKKTLKKSHGQLVDRIKSKMKQASAQHPTGPSFSPFQLPSTSHARHHSQNSLSGSYNSGPNGYSPPQPPLQTQHAPSYATLGNQMNLPYRPSYNNKSLPATPGDENNSAYPQPLHARHTSKGSIPTHKPSSPNIGSQPGVHNSYVHTSYSDFNNNNCNSYDVNSPPQPASQASYAPNGDANQRAGRQQSGPIMVELE